MEYPILCLLILRLYRLQKVLERHLSFKLDAKGRVFIPAKWRDALGDTVVVTQGVLAKQGDQCLFGMSSAEWHAFSEKLMRLPITDAAGQTILRRLYAMAAACEVDRQGRILIPAQLRERAGLTKDATLIGVGERIELWNPRALAAYTRQTDEEYGEALGRLAEIGI